MLMGENFTLFTIVITVILIAGFVNTLSKYITWRARIRFATDFLDKYHILMNSYFSSHNIDAEAYHWLTLHSARMQLLMGPFGIVDYRPPYANYILRNYQMVLNALPEIRTGLIFETDITNLDDMIIRFIGWERDRANSFRNRLFNPFAWLQEGMRFIILLPLQVMEWIGIAKEGTINRADNSRSIGILAGIFSLLGIIGTIVGLTVDWEQFIKIIKPLLAKF